MFRPPVPLFVAKPLAPANNGWGNPWAAQTPQQPFKPEWAGDIERKRAFATQLAKGQKPVDAGLIVFGEDLQSALWATAHWLRDPVVMEIRETVENAVNLLDKDQLSVKLLKFADEKINGDFIHESKDRLAALKLYAEIQGMMPKTGIDLSKNNFVNNEMKITFVEADSEQQKPEIKTIEHNEVQDLDNALQIDLKLVG